MADSKNTEKATAAAPAAATAGTDHDRVVALSVRKDGTLDQHDPEIIGDKDAAIEATKRQFAEIAVSAVDAVRRPELGLAGTEEGSTADANIDKLKAEHDKAAAAAESKAEALVNSLHKG